MDVHKFYKKKKKNTHTHIKSSYKNIAFLLFFFVTKTINVDFLFTHNARHLNKYGIERFKDAYGCLHIELQVDARKCIFNWTHSICIQLDCLNLSTRVKERYNKLVGFCQIGDVIPSIYCVCASLSCTPIVFLFFFY